MKVFVDYHHTDLYYALHCLFEKRLGWELYRPTGLDWHYQQYWKLGQLHNDFQFVHFMLETGGVMDKPWIPGWNYKKDEIYYLFDATHEFFHKAITLDTFKNMDFDIIISSVSIHDIPYQELQEKFQPKAKLISHIGNWQQKTHYKNVIYSSPFVPDASQNTVLCHQELDKNFFNYQIPDSQTKVINSIVSFLPYSDIYHKYKEFLSPISMHAYGGGCPDGGLFGVKGVSQKMKEATLGWHMKPFGGLGHTAMGWSTIGRGIITNMSEHRRHGGEAIRLFEPGVTCLDIEAYTVHEGAKAIRNMLEPEVALKYSYNIKKRFNEIVDYDREEENVRKFLERLI